MGQIIGKLNGQDVTNVIIHYENLYVTTADGAHHYLQLKDVLSMMSEFIFDIEMKKTRSWLHPVTPDVEHLYDPEHYKEIG